MRQRHRQNGIEKTSVRRKNRRPIMAFVMYTQSRKKKGIAFARQPFAGMAGMPVSGLAA